MLASARQTPSRVASALWQHAPPANRRRVCQYLARAALTSLHAELLLYPKPGLVSPHDNGSHSDMNAASFMRSLFSLRHFFLQIADAGWQAADFAHLKQLGQQAEVLMLRASGGVNTHRGAIFALGLLCAAAARCVAQNQPLSVLALRTALRTNWGQALAAHRAPENGALSHGTQVARQWSLSGAREEAAQAFPSVFVLALPRLQTRLAQGASWQQALLDAFFCLMAQIHDTNVLYRGGLAGADLVRQEAQAYLAHGGSQHPDWWQHAYTSHQRLIAARLSPGGAADLLAATCFVHLLLAPETSPANQGAC